jgi:NET1-associated nuclear protein 1 (U3 small nucleolar RNA-associated protein 17)
VVRKWNWATGQEIKQWKSSEKLLCIAEQSRDQKSESASLLLIHEGSDQDCRLTQGKIIDSSDNINEEVILEHKSLASWVKVLDDGRCLVLHAGDRLLLGQMTRKLEGLASEYTWREVELPQNINSIDARAHSLSSGKTKNHLAVNIVVGCQNGSILIYDDVLFRLKSKEKNPSEDDVVARRLHWHRTEVSTVKWSLDGNYIISGGHETVMVIWQLDTGQQQFLPHLSAAIQDLTVSQTGAAYAVHLADNSVLVLSTSELQPTAYISGLALRRRRRHGKKTMKTPAVFDHKDSTTVALAVPADYPVKSTTDPKATLLQTYDIPSQRQTNRQALVRNNITALNVGPLGNTVQEPDVTHVKVGHNGKWLASIDEWAPPEQENASLYPTDDDPLSHGKEIFLKFWARNDSAQLWELVTKIENPHSTRTRISIPILDLQANSHRLEFSTISANGSISIWTPKSRHRSGLPVKDKSGSQLYTWTCQYTVEIPLPHQFKISTPTTKATQTSCSLAYSPDSSVLATSSNASRHIHFIDPTTGQIHHTQAGSHPGPFSALTFLNHHLITISKDLRVYNTVSGDLLYALALSSSVSDVLLAANGMDGTFAVVLQVPGRRISDNGKEIEGDGKEGMADRKRMREGKLRSQIMVFDLKDNTPIFRKIVDGSVEVLLSLQERGESGYVIVNDKAEVMYLRTKQAKATLMPRKKMEDPTFRRLLQDKAANPLEDLFGPRKHTEEIDAGADEPKSQRLASGVDADTYEGMTHKTHSSLNDVFNRSSNVPVRDLFEQVVRVLKGRGEEEKE